MKKIITTFILTLFITGASMFIYYNNELNNVNDELRIAQQTISKLQQEQELKITEIAKLEDVIKENEEIIKVKSKVIVENEKEKNTYEEIIRLQKKTLKEQKGKITRLESEVNH